MSNLTTAVDRAESVSSDKAAARLYNDIEHELALGGDGTEEGYENGEAALKILEQRFPGVEAAAREVTTPPRLSRRAGRGLESDRRPLEAQDRAEHEARRRTGTGSRISRATAIHSRRSSSWGGRRFGQTGIPGAAESATQLLMQTVGMIAGISLLYLLVQPKGSSAVSTFFDALTTAFRGFASPNVDPLQKSTYAAAGPIKGPALYGPGSALAGATQSAQDSANAAMSAVIRAIGAGAHKTHGSTSPINQAANKAAAHVGAF